MKIREILNEGDMPPQPGLKELFESIPSGKSVLRDTGRGNHNNAELRQHPSHWSISRPIEGSDEREMIATGNEQHIRKKWKDVKNKHFTGPAKRRE